MVQRDNVLRQLDRMVEQGQVTADEATRLRAADTAEEFDAAIGAIRARHAGASLDAAVRRGDMSPDEAAANLESIRSGAHPRGLRARLRGLHGKGDHRRT